MRIVATQVSISNKAFEIYLAGCNANPKCLNCHNPELWDFNIGDELGNEAIDNIIKKINNAKTITNNIWILGGEPLDQNKSELLNLVQQLKILDMPIWCFTRYEINEIDVDIKRSFNYIKTGKYIENLKTENIICYGVRLASKNQKIHKLN